MPVVNGIRLLEMEHILANRIQFLRTSNKIHFLLAVVLVRLSRRCFFRGFHPRLDQSAALQLRSEGS